VKFGRRPVYLLSTFLMGIACVWLGVASTKSYTPFLVGRAFLGIFEAPIESIAPSTVTDIFFLHDRGEKISMYGLSVLGGNELGPMLSAFIIQSLGMNWAFYIVAMFIGLSLVAMFFGMPETKFTGVRPSILRSSVEVSEKSNNLHVEVAETKKKRSYVGELAFWGSSDPDVKLWKVFLRPFVLLSYPTVLWACLIYGMALSWNVILGATTAQLFGKSPFTSDLSA
jgi:MFS family permease